MAVRLLLVLSVACLASGCFYTSDLAIQRASREFSCPADDVRVQDRSDISDGLFDIEACGNRARYACFASKYMYKCIREPDPPRWDPDPKYAPTRPGAGERLGILEREVEVR